MEEKKILPLVEEVLAEVNSKLQGKAGQNYEEKLVRLIRDQEVLGDPSSERPEVCSKLQGKAILNHELKTVRLIRDKKACRDKKPWTIQA